jgi:hypothetical protein
MGHRNTVRLRRIEENLNAAESARQLSNEELRERRRSRNAGSLVFMAGTFHGTRWMKSRPTGLRNSWNDFRHGGSISGQALIGRVVCHIQRAMLPNLLGGNTEQLFVRGFETGTGEITQCRPRTNDEDRPRKALNRPPSAVLREQKQPKPLPMNCLLHGEAYGRAYLIARA